MSNDKQLVDKKIIIFGASRGIGFNIASHLITNGSDVTISSGNEENLNSALLDLKEKFPNSQNISKITVDFSQYTSLDESLSPLLDIGYVFDTIIISSAVLGPSGDFAETKFEDWLDTFDVNVFGCAKLIHFFLENNLIGKNGKIIIMSGGISSPDPYFISFSATKHALNGFAYSLSHQLCDKGIWINSVLPGSYHTKMNEIRIERGPKDIGKDNYELAISRINDDETEKYEKLYNLIDYLCSSSSNGIYGRLISAQYDNWQNNIERLKDQDDDLFKIIRKKD